MKSRYKSALNRSNAHARSRNRAAQRFYDEHKFDGVDPDAGDLIQ